MYYEYIEDNERVSLGPGGCVWEHKWCSNPELWRPTARRDIGDLSADAADALTRLLRFHEGLKLRKVVV